jgi:hypothetical protein
MIRPAGIACRLITDEVVGPIRNCIKGVLSGFIHLDDSIHLALGNTCVMATSVANLESASSVLKNLLNTSSSK